MAFQVPYILLAEQVQDIGNGKMNILGTFDQITMTEGAGIYHGFFVIALLVAENEDELGKHTVTHQIRRPGGQLAGEGGATIDLKLRQGTWGLCGTRLVIGAQNVPFRESGRHYIVILVDGREVASHPLMVRFDGAAAQAPPA